MNIEKQTEEIFDFRKKITNINNKVNAQSFEHSPT